MLRGARNDTRMAENNEYLVRLNYSSQRTNMDDQMLTAKITDRAHTRALDIIHYDNVLKRI
jgi:hypothetical protein